jgi:hypothetical protein
VESDTHSAEGGETSLRAPGSIGVDGAILKVNDHGFVRCDVRWRAWAVAVVGALGTVMSVGSGADAETEPVLSVVVHPSNRSAAG